MRTPGRQDLLDEESEVKNANGMPSEAYDRPEETIELPAEIFDRIWSREQEITGAFERWMGAGERSDAAALPAGMMDLASASGPSLVLQRS